MSDNKRYNDKDRRRQVIPGYNKDEFNNDYVNKRSRRIDQEFETNDNSAVNSSYSSDNKRYPDKPFAERHNTPTNIICVLNLAFEATEAMLWEEMKGDRLRSVRIITDKETRRPRGFAFLSFPSIVDASNIITKYPSSSGIGVGNPLVLCGQQCYIEYSTTVADSRYDRRIDWICESCNTHNPGRRLKCLKCHYARTDSCQDPERLLFEFSQTPSLACLIKGLGLSATEHDIVASFSMYAPVQKGFIFRDEVSGISRGYALIEFDTVESASKVVSTHGYFTVKGIQVVIGYATPQCTRQAHNSIPYQATKQPSLSAMPSTMYNYPMMMYPMYQQPYLYPMANNTNQYVQQSMQQSMQQSVQQNMQQSMPVGQVEQPIQQQSTQSTQTQQPQMRKKGESLSQSIRKLEDGRPYPSDYSTNSLNYMFDPQSGYYYESKSQFYYCLSRNLYLDSITGQYYQLSNKELIPFTPLPPSYVQEESIPQKEEKDENIDTPKNPLITTPIQFQFNSQTQHIQAKPKIEIKFNSNFNQLVNETSQQDNNKEKATQEENKFQTDFKPGQSVHIEYKTKQYIKEKKRKEPEQLIIKIEPPSLEKIQNITGWSKHGVPACFICRRKFHSEEELSKHLEHSLYHQYWLKQWMKYHQEQSSEYRNRAEERRKTVGSTAFVSVRRAAPQPVPIMPVATAPTVIPGKTIEENKPTNNIPESTPSVIGRMLLEKDGWLEKHKEEDDDSLMKNKTSFRGGLGYEETKKSGYDAMILQGDSFFKK